MGCPKKERRLKLLAQGLLFCDCDNLATHLDNAGEPECDRCAILNSQAMSFHDQTRTVFLENSQMICCP